MSSKQWETLANEALADAREWKHRARVADDTARRLLLALAALLDEADMGEVCEETQAVVDQARAAIAAARGEA
jgi:phage shock protein A